eukprot:CAMPEP_0204608968 /NCGR_PEP_ID=MMETSP0661-20131031/60642_1 /ASSEMBLY_ACC=CAM_ASM_000606 /TAXON_ID=109239 /ORGANISM="Alexandrium margalefi, Strain AMGDE01CS-322" /LENGTH=38 /DNA_ID= /DNA_START= /DNA_END= /DNA_ORIENTATION=
MPEALSLTASDFSAIAHLGLALGKTDGHWTCLVMIDDA